MNKFLFNALSLPIQGELEVGCNPSCHQNTETKRADIRLIKLLRLKLRLQNRSAENEELHVIEKVTKEDRESWRGVKLSRSDEVRVSDN
jgi:hypothetical protein